jgi:hypothetical protein
MNTGPGAATRAAAPGAAAPGAAGPGAAGLLWLWAIVTNHGPGDLPPPAPVSR